MTKKEIIWRDILYRAIEKKETKFRQKDLAVKFGFSLSTVFNALKAPRSAGAIEVTGRGFRVIDSEKFLYLWATQRNMEKEIIYKTYIPKSPAKIEGEMPNGVIFSGCSAYIMKYQNAPADYAKVYVYAEGDDLEKIKNRFSKNKSEPNLFVLKSDAYLQKFGVLAPDIQIFVDLWNLKDWYAKDFIKALKDKLFL